MLGLRKTARIVGIDHSYLARLAKEGRVPRNDDRSFDPEAVRLAIEATTDPCLVRSDRRKRVTRAAASPVTADRVDPWLDSVDPAHRLALRLVLTMLCRAGAMAAKSAIDAGASLPVAFALHTRLSEDFTDVFTEAATEVLVGIDVDDLEMFPFDRGRIKSADWAALAGLAGERLDLKACRSWLAERERLLDEAEAAENRQQRG